MTDNHTRDGDSDTRAKFLVKMAIKKDGKDSTVILTIRCDVTAADATLDVRMNPAGVMGMKLVDGTLRNISRRLPKRVVGDDPNALEVALENSIGRKGIGIVKQYIATGSLTPWDGLIRAVVASYAIRSALQTTFADKDDKKDAINVKKIRGNFTETQHLRVAALWIPVLLSILSRVLTWVFPSILTGGLSQILCWIGIEIGCAGGIHYKEISNDGAIEVPSFLNISLQTGTSAARLGKDRDRKIGLGSYRVIRRLVNRGRITGVGGVEEEDLESKLSVKDQSQLN